MGFDPNTFTMGLIQTLGQQIGEGQQRVRENQILGELLPQIQQAQDPEDVLQSILQLQGTPGVRPETQARFAGLAPQFAALASQRQKQQQQQIQKQQEEQQRLSTVDLAAKVSGIDRQDLENLPQTSLNTIVRENVRKKDVLSPNEQAFEQLQKPVLDNISKINENRSSANRLLRLTREGDVGIDFDDPNSANKIRSAFRFLGVDIPLTVDEAQAQRIILDKADELKKKFGARVTNFDFEKWLEGQPDKRKFRNANIAVALMQQSAAEVDQKMFDAWQNIVNDPRISSEQRVNALLQKQRNIIEEQDKVLNNKLAQLKKNPGKRFQPDSVLFEDDQGNQFLIPKDQASEAQRRARNEGVEIRVVQ